MATLGYKYIVLRGYMEPLGVLGFKVSLVA